MESNGNGNEDVKDLFTTGEAADICRVSQQTIIRCFDSGQLEGFRVPGPGLNKRRRIPRKDLIGFMRKNNIPTDRLESGKKRVLIVDDDVEIVEKVAYILSLDGRYEIMAASGGFEAGLATPKFRPDLILLDYTLPDVNAKTVCQAIKGDPEFEHIRVIIISGVVKEDEIEQLPKLGAEFIKKPFSDEELRNKIEAALGTGR